MIIGDVARHWYVYLSIPLMAAVIGYVTKLVAIRMMFRPLEYRSRMASIACDLMTTQLISPADVVRRLDPERIAKQVADPLQAVAGELVREIARGFPPR